MSGHGGGSSPGRTRSVTVDRREAGTRLDLFLVGAVAGLSRKRAKALVDGRQVRVNGRIEPMASRVLRGGETVAVDLEPPRAAAPPPALPPVLWEGARALALDKPAGIPSGPTRDPARPHVEKLVRAQRGGGLTLVHRLDRDTTGVLLFGKDPEAARLLMEAFRERRVRKVYLALVQGRPPAAFQVTSHLREGQGRVHTVRSGGMRAETRFETLLAGADHALVRALPRTGRMHQIRVHLARRGFPIVGDGLYGGAGEVAGQPVPRQMLHALELVFPDPGSGEEVRVSAPLPADFRATARRALGREIPPALLAGGAPQRGRGAP